jgi:hypothetical protein
VVLLVSISKRARVCCCVLLRTNYNFQPQRFEHLAFSVLVCDVGTQHFALALLDYNTQRRFDYLTQLVPSEFIADELLESIQKDLFCF